MERRKGALFIFSSLLLLSWDAEIKLKVSRHTVASVCQTVGGETADTRPTDTFSYSDKKVPRLFIACNRNQHVIYLVFSTNKRSLLPIGNREKVKDLSCLRLFCHPTSLGTFTMPKKTILRTNTLIRISSSNRICEW